MVSISWTLKISIFWSFNQSFPLFTGKQSILNHAYFSLIFIPFQTSKTLQMNILSFSKLSPRLNLQLSFYHPKFSNSKHSREQTLFGKKVENIPVSQKCFPKSGKHSSERKLFSTFIIWIYASKSSKEARWLKRSEEPYYLSF